MQAYEDREGMRKFDIFHEKTVGDLRNRMEARKAEIEADGGKVTERRMLTKNSKCPCGSGRAIKKCCKYILGLA